MKSSDIILGILQTLTTYMEEGFLHLTFWPVQM